MPEEEPITVDEIIARLVVIGNKITELRGMVDELIRDGNDAQQ